LRSWREFRRSINNLSTEDALLQTIIFWSQAPFVPFNLDATNQHCWPDPWTLIEENVYCDIAKCLGIVYTIALTEHRKHLDIEMRIYKDINSGLEYNLAWIDQGKYILNMIDNEIVNIKQFNKTLKLTHKFTAVELKIDYYNN
jgi:hypothetical protein